MIHLRFKMYDVFEYCILDLPTGVQGSADTAFFIWVLAFSVIAKATSGMWYLVCSSWPETDS